MKLYSYFQSSAAYRVRIALALKGIETEQIAIDLLDRVALPNFQEKINPQGFVPALETDEHGLVVQSLSIIEYLDERYPEPPLLPGDLRSRAYVRASALSVVRTFGADRGVN